MTIACKSPGCRIPLCERDYEIEWIGATEWVGDLMAMLHSRSRLGAYSWLDESISEIVTPYYNSGQYLERSTRVSCSPRLASISIIRSDIGEKSVG